MQIIWWNRVAVGIEFGPRILWFIDAPIEARQAYAAYDPFPQDAWLRV